MLLAIDVGNTNIVVGLFRGERLEGNWRLATDATRTTDEYAVLLEGLLGHTGNTFDQVSGVSISSVVPTLTATFREFGERYLDLPALVVSAKIETGIKIVIDNPVEMGADRIVNALAALRMHRVPAIVIDFGTATTFDAVSGAGELLGSAIAPGLLTAMEGLYHRAARLFSVELLAPRAAIGHDTASALQSGAIFGYAGLVEGLVARFRRELGGDPLVIATGGLAPVVVGATDVVDVTDPYLTLHGLRLIHELNVDAETRRRGDAETRRRGDAGTRRRGDGETSPRPRVPGQR